MDKLNEHPLRGKMESRILLFVDTVKTDHDAFICEIKENFGLAIRSESYTANRNGLGRWDIYMIENAKSDAESPLNAICGKHGAAYLMLTDCFSEEDDCYRSQTLFYDGKVQSHDGQTFSIDAFLKGDVDAILDLPLYEDDSWELDRIMEFFRGEA